MSGNKFLYILVSFLVVGGCQSSNHRASLTPLQPTTHLENVIQGWDQYLKDIQSREPAQQSIAWQEEFSRICANHESLCETPSKNSTKREKLERSQFEQAKRFIKSESFDELSQYAVDFSLKLFSRAKESQLIEFSENLLKDSSCKTVNLRHGLASILEDSLPKESVRQQVLALYEINSQCEMTKTVALSSYRAAMLRLLEHSCEKAQPLLDKVSSSNEDYLKPRSLYWSWKCQGGSPTAKVPSDKLPYFSYHRILMGVQDISSSNDKTMLLDQTPATTVSNKMPALNEVILLAERLLARGQISPARYVLEKVRLERVQESEPEFQIYWSHLLHSSHSGIRKFQVLSSLINSRVEFRSKTVKSMLFPNQFFEYVEASTKKLDPWLVQALIRQESAFDPHARSRVGATGLMQLMPSTAKRVARINRTQLKDPERNVQVGVKFLERLVDRFDGQVPLALAAYNAGPNKVADWVKRYPTSDIMLFVDTIPYRETREYVAFILRNYHWYKSLNTSAQVQVVPASNTGVSGPTTSSPDQL